MNFVYDVEKDDFLKSWRSLSIHSDGFLAARTSRTNERQETCPELTSFGLFTERMKKLPELTSFRVFTERTKKLAEPTSFRVLLNEKGNLPNQRGLRYLPNERSNGYGFFSLKIREMTFFNPCRERRRMARTKNTAEKNIQIARSNVC